MRTHPPEKVARDVQVTGRFRTTHSAPIHIGDPAAIGITDLSKNLGPTRAEPIVDGHVPLFCACSVTAEVVAPKA